MANGNLQAKRAAAAKREKEKQAKISKRKSNVGRVGYDKYGVKKMSQKKKESSKKEKLQKKYQERAKSLLTNKGQGTPKDLKKREEGPKTRLEHIKTTKNTAKGGKGLQVKKYDTFGKKAKDLKTPDLVTKGRIGKLDAQIKKQKEKRGLDEAKKIAKKKEAEKKAAHAKSRKESGVSDEKYNRLTKKSKALNKKVDEAGATSRKGIRLAKKAKRKEERAAGTRKSGVGTALSKVGRGAFGALAALGGEGAAIKKAGSEGAYYKTAAHKKKKAKVSSDEKKSETPKKPTKMQKAAKAHFSKLAKTKMDTKIKKPKKTKY